MQGSFFDFCLFTAIFCHPDSRLREASDISFLEYHENDFAYSCFTDAC